MKKIKKLIIIGIVLFIFLLTFASPLLIMYYAEEQYFVDQYKKNKSAFEDVKNEMLLTLESENATELLLVITYDSEKGRLLHSYKNNDFSIDANGESYNIVDKAFGDFCLSKIYVTQGYVCLSEEGNNYQYIYSSGPIPESARFAPKDNDKVHELGNNWYLITPN